MIIFRKWLAKQCRKVKIQCVSPNEAQNPQSAPPTYAASNSHRLVQVTDEKQGQGSTVQGQEPKVLMCRELGDGSKVLYTTSDAAAVPTITKQRTNV